MSTMARAHCSKEEIVVKLFSNEESDKALKYKKVDSAGNVIEI